MIKRYLTELGMFTGALLVLLLVMIPVVAAILVIPFFLSYITGYDLDIFLTTGLIAAAVVACHLSIVDEIKKGMHQEAAIEAYAASLKEIRNEK